MEILTLLIKDGIKITIIGIVILALFKIIEIVFGFLLGEIAKRRNAKR